MKENYEITNFLYLKFLNLYGMKPLNQISGMSSEEDNS